jgi:hypothetical protein
MEKPDLRCMYRCSYTDLKFSVIKVSCYRQINGVDAFHPFHLRTETDPASETFDLEHWTADKVQKLSNP